MKQKIFRFIADLRFSIFLLLLISLFSIIGTVIEQDQSIEVYKINYPLTNPVLGFLTWDRITKFELDHVYETWWFSAIILLFGLSLISCTSLQQLPSLKVSRRCQFFRTIKQFSRLKIFTKLTYFSLNRILTRIKINQYSIFQQKNILYCYKGLTGRIAPILVHFSIILILIGTIIGSLFGFKAQEIVPKTENFHIQNILNNGQLSVIPKTATRINDFWITYTNKQTISQFYSDISILDFKGNEIKRKTISVNYPLVNDNIYYYQTDWNLTGLRFKNNDNYFSEYPLLNLGKIWLTWISINNSLNNGFIVIIDNLQGYCSIYNEVGQFLANMEWHEKINLNYPMILVDIISSTGLQIKIDPGISTIYIGFFLLMVSTIVSYITYSQIWLIKRNQKLFIGGTTSRALFDFELEFFKFIK